MNTRPHFLFAGGGSGGHVFPGIAVARELMRLHPDCTIQFVASRRQIDRRILEREDFDTISMPMAPSPRKLRELGAFSAALIKCAWSASRVLQTQRPNVIVGLGGFASVPVGLAARWHGVPLVLLEQNVVPGRATSLLSRFAEETCLSFAESLEHWQRGRPATVTGNPVVGSIRMNECREKCEKRKTLLVLGGSQGAVGVNSMTLSAVASLRDFLVEWRVVHQTGESQATSVRDAYRQIGVEAVVSAFFDDIATQYGAADLAVSRAGATTLAEIACMGLPAVLIPYPNSARDHQQRNAELFARAGAAIVVQESYQAADELETALRSLLCQPTRLQAMSSAMADLARPNAAYDAAVVISRHCGPCNMPAMPLAPSPHVRPDGSKLARKAFGRDRHNSFSGNDLSAAEQLVQRFPAN